MTQVQGAQLVEVQRFLEEVVPRQQAADDVIHRGDPGPRKALWSHEDPVTVFGAAGVVASGWAECRQVFEWLAEMFTGCESFELGIVAAGVSGDLAYTVGYEHSVVSREGGPMRPNALRVTHVYRRENGEWKIVHRHGDGLETDRVGRGTASRN
jgi:ketosteroid isomerase-like protein